MFTLRRGKKTAINQRITYVRGIICTICIRTQRRVYFMKDEKIFSYRLTRRLVFARARRRKQMMRASGERFRRVSPRNISLPDSRSSSFFLRSNFDKSSSYDTYVLYTNTLAVYLHRSTVTRT